jgi:hypothetical protein
MKKKCLLSADINPQTIPSVSVIRKNIPQPPNFAVNFQLQDCKNSVAVPATDYNKAYDLEEEAHGHVFTIIHLLPIYSS